MDRNRGGRPRHPDVLTPAEWRVLEALREGGTNAEIGARLGLGRDTVKYHISNMLAKLELRDRRELAAWRPDAERGRLGAVLAVPAVVWAVVGRPLVWVGVGTATVAGVAVAVIAAVGVVVVAFVLATGDSDASPFAASSQSAPAPVVSCDSGIAVTNPAANTELVGDCEALLGLRDRIRGTGRLNWAGGKAMSEWTGVTVSGTPQRVTGLNLADLGLDGQLSGLLGNLTGLTALDLSGNALTGMIPSKLALLTNLTTVSLSGTSFTGCAPPALRQVAGNDVAGTGLADCWAHAYIEENVDTNSDGILITSGTYYIEMMGVDGEPRLVFDIPEGASLLYEGIMLVERRMPGPNEQRRSVGNVGVSFKDTDSSSYLSLSLEYGGEFGFSPDDDITAEQRQALRDILDLMAESTWIVHP